MFDYNEDLMHHMDLYTRVFYFKMKNIFPQGRYSPPKPQEISKYFAQWIKEFVHSQKARPNIIISSLRKNLKMKHVFGKPFYQKFTPFVH